MGGRADRLWGRRRDGRARRAEGDGRHRVGSGRRRSRRPPVKLLNRGWSSAGTAGSRGRPEPVAGRRKRPKPNLKRRSGPPVGRATLPATTGSHEDPSATLDNLREAVTTLEDIDPIARRVFGGSHPVTEGIDDELREARAALRAREDTQP